MVAWWFLLITLCSFGSMGASAYYFIWVMRREDLPEAKRRIPSLIRKGSQTYLERLYVTLLMAIVFGALVLKITFDNVTAAALIFGASTAALSGFVGMAAAVRANSRTTLAASQESGLGKAFLVAFRAGAVMGMGVVGTSLLGVATLWQTSQNLTVLWGYGLGASFLALLAKVGGGVYTKAADIAADLVGKLKAGLEEDDYRNPAVIADQVGDNVGDVAGQGADLNDSYIAILIAALAIAIGANLGPIYVLWPLLISATGIIASLIGLFCFAQFGQNDTPQRVLNRSSLATNLVFVALTFGLAWALRGLKVSLGLALATVAGAAAMSVIGLTSASFTSLSGKAVRETARASCQGAAFNIITADEWANKSLAWPILGICAAMVVAWQTSVRFGINGMYTVAISAVGMLATCGMTVTADAFGPIVDNADGIGEMLGMDGMVTRVTSILDAAGNTVKAITKAASIGAAALTIISLLYAYCQQAQIEVLRVVPGFIVTPGFIIGGFLGGLMPRIFTAYLFAAVGRNAMAIARVVERHFVKIGLLTPGQTPPEEDEEGPSPLIVAIKDQLGRLRLGFFKEQEETDPSTHCIALASEGAMRALIKPGLLAVFGPIVVGFLLGKYTLAGFLLGSVFVSTLDALALANFGAITDNAKKFVEAGNLGGKGSPTHAATIVGDTVGDPRKDTAGPSLNTLLAVIFYIANLIAPLVASYSLLTL